MTLENDGGGEDGGADRRRIHLREISGDSESPLETVGQDLRAARLRRGDEIAPGVARAQDPQGPSGSAGGRPAGRPAGQDLCDRLCAFLCRAIWAWTRPHMSSASSATFPAAPTTRCMSPRPSIMDDGAPPAAGLAHHRRRGGDSAGMGRLASSVARHTSNQPVPPRASAQRRPSRAAPKPAPAPPAQTATPSPAASATARRQCRAGAAEAADTPPPAAGAKSPATSLPSHGRSAGHARRSGRPGPQCPRQWRRPGLWRPEYESARRSCAPAAMSASPSRTPTAR